MEHECKVSHEEHEAATKNTKINAEFGFEIQPFERE
jgi:hypothetical protein